MSAAPGRPLELQLVHAQSVAPQAWRNGGGQTRELLAWPPGDAWKLRISRADITVDGPFSVFAEVQRWFTVLRGAGVMLDFVGTERERRQGDAPLCFDGAAAPGCRLLDGATQDLNLMARHGEGLMQEVQVGQGWSVPPTTMRGLYTTVGGQWRSGAQVCDLPADTLLWAGKHDGAAWMFQPHPPGEAHSAWWLAFTPEE